MKSKTHSYQSMDMPHLDDPGLIIPLGSGVPQDIPGAILLFYTMSLLFTISQINFHCGHSGRY